MITVADIIEDAMAQKLLTLIAGWKTTLILKCRNGNQQNKHTIILRLIFTDVRAKISQRLTALWNYPKYGIPVKLKTGTSIKKTMVLKTNRSCIGRKV